MSDDQKSAHLASVRALRATRTAKRNAALIGPLADAIEYLLGAPIAAPPSPIPADVDDSDTESVGTSLQRDDDPSRAALPTALSVPEAAAPETEPLLAAPVGSFTVELASPAAEDSRAAALAAREKETRKRLNKQGSKAEIERRCRRIMRDPPRGAGRGSTDSETVQALRSEDPKVFHVNLYV